MKTVILSDIHGNLSALQAVIADFECKYSVKSVILLGDLIDYGMRSNEVIETLRELESRLPIICNLCGNHEIAVLHSENHLENFSSERGRVSLKYTMEHLTRESFEYIQTKMETSGWKTLECDGHPILAVHGDLKNPYWGKMEDEQLLLNDYEIFDYVFSGHSHKPHLKEIYYKTGNLEMRNRKKTIFINPGSVGQPRNHNPLAQYVMVDGRTGTVHFNTVEYDIEAEQKLFTNEVDIFYRDRLSKGI